MTKKKTKQIAEDKPISSKELKFWLKGILEFQSNDWVPNKEQWESIKSKIFNLQESEVVQNIVNVPPQRIEEANFRPMIPPRPGDDYNDMIGEPELLKMNTPQLPLGGTLDSMPEGGNQPNAGNFPNRIIGSGNVQGVSPHSKARNIDSSHGYKTDFK